MKKYNMENGATYEDMREKMKEFPIPAIEGERSDEKREEILRERKELYEGEECDGLNLRRSVWNGKITKRAQDVCPHEFETNMQEDFTNDIRKRLTRAVICEKCGFREETVIEEKTKMGWM